MTTVGESRAILGKKSRKKKIHLDAGGESIKKKKKKVVERGISAKKKEGWRWGVIRVC